MCADIVQDININDDIDFNAIEREILDQARDDERRIAETSGSVVCETDPDISITADDFLKVEPLKRPNDIALKRMRANIRKLPSGRDFDDPMFDELGADWETIDPSSSFSFDTSSSDSDIPYAYKPWKNIRRGQRRRKPEPMRTLDEVDAFTQLPDDVQLISARIETIEELVSDIPNIRDDIDTIMKMLSQLIDAKK